MVSIFWFDEVEVADDSTILVLLVPLLIPPPRTVAVEYTPLEVEDEAH